MSYARKIGEACGDYGNGAPVVPTSRKYTAILTLILYTWMDITVNIVQTPALLLVADFAGDRQMLGAACGQVWYVIAALVISGYIEIWGAAHLTLHYFLGMLCVLMAISVGIPCIFIKEIPLKQDVDEESRSKRIVQAFYMIYKGLKMLSRVLVGYAIVFFCVAYGSTAYGGNNGQFFGIEVYGGHPNNADKCGDLCSEAQNNYNRGVRVASGSTDLISNLIGIGYAYALPFMVKTFGAKATLTAMLVPQALLMVMVFCKVVWIDVFIVIISGFSSGAIYGMVTPVIVHVCGEQADIGIYVGTLNSAGAGGQLLNFVAGAGLVETSFGYKLPVFLGGFLSFVGMVLCFFFFKVKMYTL